MRIHMKLRDRVLPEVAFICVVSHPMCMVLE